MHTHRYASGGFTLWGLLGAICGVFSGSKAKIYVHQLFRGRKFVWATMLQPCGLVFEKLVFPSRRAVVAEIRRSGHERDSRFTRSKRACGTSALLALLHHLAVACQSDVPSAC